MFVKILLRKGFAEKHQTKKGHKFLLSCGMIIK